MKLKTYNRLLIAILSLLMLSLLSGCCKTRQVIKTELEEIYKVVDKKISPELLEDCKIVVTKQQSPTYLDLKKQAQEQRHECELTNKRLEILRQQNDR